MPFSPSLGSKRSSSNSISSQRVTEKPQPESSVEPIKPDFSGKRKRKEAAATNNEIDMAILTELKNSKEETDGDGLFMKSRVFYAPFI